MEQEKKFGDIVREARERLKVGNPEFSLRRFAVRVGISPTFLSKVETNEFPAPKAKKVIKIAEALGLDPNMLLAKAGRIAPDLKRIVTEKQPEMAEFLRTAEGMSAAQWGEMLAAAKKIKEGGNDGKQTH